MKLSVNDVIHGFRVDRVREVGELDGILYEMTFVKNGAKLCWLYRPDNNKTFTVTFKTIPENDTGVFHILEHSVLCGSDKYPVKEPFVELLKGSLQTFLNAFTFPDKTMYPVSSRNDKDFLNLIDVYMDAVLHPAIIKNRNIFMQEGWRYEMKDAGSEPGYNGVVFNEMKGDYSSADSIMSEKMSNLLFPDVCYGCDSGGNPEFIPTLTYEYFLDCHRRYYHPSNSRIFIDGDLNIDAVLEKIESFIAPYDYLEINSDIPMQTPVSGKEYRGQYEISETEDTENKAYIGFGYMTSRFDEPEKNCALSILCDVLCGTNESPLKKAILDAGLGEEVYFGGYDGVQQNFTTLEIRNTEADKLDEIRRVVSETIKSLCDNGIEPSLLRASFNSYEFRTRERDFGTFPRGLVFIMTAMDSWLYGGDPMQNLLCDGILSSLREKLETGYFEKLLGELFAAPAATVILTPSKTLGKERLDNEAARLAAAKQSWSSEDIEKIIADGEVFRKWQETDDTPEQLATLPALSLEDINPLPEKLNIEVEKRANGELITHSELNTGGIIYANVYFPFSGLTPDELSALSLLCELLTRTDTKQHDSFTLQNLIREQLGGLGVGTSCFVHDGENDKCFTCLTAGVSALPSKKDEAISLLKEVLNDSVFDNKQLILNIVRQRKLGAEQSMVSSGHSYGATRVRAYQTSSGAFSEYTGGYEAYKWIKHIEADFDSCADELIATLNSLYNRIFRSGNVIVNVSGTDDSNFIDSLFELVPERTEAMPEGSPVPIGIRREGIITPASVAFAVKGTNIYNLGLEYNGAFRVAGSLLSLGYLWNAIRVQGGAYGTGFSVNSSGNAFFYSYRDPNANRSLGCYADAAQFLRDFADGDEDLTKFIIGAIGDTEPLMSPRVVHSTAATRYICGITYEYLCRVRSEILSADRDSLRAAADVIDKINFVDAVCVIGGKDKLEACGDKLDTLLTM